MNLTAFANQLEEEVGDNSEALLAEFPSEYETEDGSIEPALDWGEFILSRITKRFPKLDDASREELLEDVRSELCV